MGKLKKAVSSLKKRSTAIGAVGAAGMLAAAVLVVQSSPRSELDVQLSDGAVWLASTAVGGVSLLDGGSGTIAASLGVADPGDVFTVEQFGSDAVIVNQTDGTVARLDGSSWEIPTGRVQFGVPGQPMHVVTGQDTGWLMTPGQATTVELEALALRTPVPVAAPFADGIITDDGDLLYSSTDPDLPVQRFAAVGGESTTIEGLDGPTALVDLGDAIAAVDLDDRSVWLDGVGTVCEQLEFPEGAELSAGGGDGQLIVVSDQGGAFVWDPTASGCPGAANFINLGPADYGQPALTDGWAVVPEISSGSVLVIDLESMSITDRQPLEGVDAGTEVSLIAEDGSIWYNDPASAQAGLIRRDGTIVPIAKYEEGTTGFTSAPVDDAPDGSDDMSLAGAQEEPEPQEELPEAESVAGPELTTTTLAGAGDTEEPEPETPAATTTTTTSSNPDPEPEPEPEPEPDPDPDPDSTDTTQGITDPDPDPDPDPDEGTTTTSTTEQPDVDEPLAITIALTAQSVTVGNTINFTAVTQHGNPNSWTIDFSPVGPETLPIERFGSFRILFPEVGRFVATMGACDAEGECAQAQTIITIVEDPDAIPLVAAIDGPTTVVVGETASFSDISQGDPDSWSWSTDGGSPGTSSDQNVDISWPTPGPRTVTLTVGRGGSSRTTTFDIDVVNAPTPSPFGLTCSPVLVEVGNPVTCQLDGDAADFSDLAFSTSADGAAGFTSSNLSPGRFRLTSTQQRSVTVTLTATDDATGDTRSDNVSIDYFVPACAQVLPTVNVSGPITLDTGQTGSFTGTPADGCGTTSRSWSATGGGNVSSPNSDTTNISWNTPGTYTVTYNFSDGGGSSSDSMTVVVAAPETGSVSFSQVLTSIPCDGANHFVGTLSGLTPNGNLTFTAPPPGGSFAPNLRANASGEFRVSFSCDPRETDLDRVVTVVDDGSGQSIAIQYRWIGSGPAETAPSISISGPGALDTNESGSYTVTNTGGSIDSYSWTTNGGGGSGTNQNFTGSWANAGSYTVTLTVNGPGGSDTATRNVTVEAPIIPPPPFGMSCDRGSAEVDQIFNCDLTTGDPANFSNPSWSVSAGGLSWLMSDWSYDAAGTVAGSTITVTLSATVIATGETVTSSDSVSITAPVQDPEVLTVGCDQGTAEQFEIVSCFLTSGNESSFNSPTWSVSGDHDRWGGSAFALDVAGNSVGSITVTLSAVDIGTGQTVSDSVTLSITEIAPPPPPPPPAMTVSCSMLNEIRARCFANNTAEYSGPSWAVSGNGFLRWGGGGFDIDVGTTEAGATITVTVTATHTSGQVSSASGSITIANAT